MPPDASCGGSVRVAIFPAAQCERSAKAICLRSILRHAVQCFRKRMATTGFFSLAPNHYAGQHSKATASFVREPRKMVHLADAYLPGERTPNLTRMDKSTGSFLIEIRETKHPPTSLHVPPSHHGTSPTRMKCNFSADAFKIRETSSEG